MSIYRILNILCILVITSICLATKIYAVDLTPLEVKVGVYDNNPKIFRDANGNTSGIFADIVNFIAKQENWNVNYVYGTFAEGLNRLEAGEIDIMVDVAIKPEREARYDFTKETVMGSWGVVYVRDDSEISTFNDLNNSTIAILENSVYLEGEQGINAYIKSFDLNAQFIEAMEYKEVFNMLNDGVVDAAVVSRIFGLANEKHYPELRATNIFFDPIEIRFALHKDGPNNNYFIERLDYWLVRLKSGYQNVFTNSLQKHGLSTMTIQKEVIPQWVYSLGIIVIGVFVVTIFVILFLRQTREIIARQLREEEYFLANIISHVPIFIISSNTSGIITLFEGSGIKMLNVDVNDLIGKPILNVFKTDKVFIHNFSRAVNGENVEFETTLNNRKYQIYLSPIKTKNNIKSIIGLGIDNTEKENLDNAKIDFLHLASHHLRTPVTEIKWSHEVLSPRMKKILKPSEYANWESIEKATERIVDLANIFSLSSWLDLKTFSISPEKLNIADLIDIEISKSQKLFANKLIKLVKDINITNNIYQDKKLLSVIIGTLLSNSFRYTSSGDQISIQVKIEDNNLMIKIKDTGWGIPKLQIDKIFSGMFRANNVEKYEPSSGIGLSLHITKKIVEHLGGKISVESKENIGSTFYVKLPMLKEFIS